MAGSASVVGVAHARPEALARRMTTGALAAPEVPVGLVRPVAAVWAALVLLVEAAALEASAAAVAAVEVSAAAPLVEAEALAVWAADAAWAAAVAVAGKPA